MNQSAKSMQIHEPRPLHHHIPKSNSSAKKSINKEQTPTKNALSRINLAYLESKTK
jgi:hypothetical protein